MFCLSFNFGQNPKCSAKGVTVLIKILEIAFFFAVFHSRIRAFIV